MSAKSKASDRASFMSWIWLAASVVGWIFDKSGLVVAGLVVALLFGLVELIAQAIESRETTIIVVRERDE